MKKIFIKVSKLSILAACICLTILVGFFFLVKRNESIKMPSPLVSILVVITFFAVACLLIASVVEVYHRVQEGKSRAVRLLLTELVIICGICFIITRKPESLITAFGVVVGSWGMNYIYRKEDNPV